MGNKFHSLDCCLCNKHSIKRIRVYLLQFTCLQRMVGSNRDQAYAAFPTITLDLFRCNGNLVRFPLVLQRHLPKRCHAEEEFTSIIGKKFDATLCQLRAANHKPNQDMSIDKKTHLSTSNQFRRDRFIKRVELRVKIRWKINLSFHQTDI